MGKAYMFALEGRLCGRGKVGARGASRGGRSLCGLQGLRKAHAGLGVFLSRLRLQPNDGFLLGGRRRSGYGRWVIGLAWGWRSAAKRHGEEACAACARRVLCGGDILNPTALFIPGCGLPLWVSAARRHPWRAGV